MAHVRCMDAQDCPVVDLWDTSFRENEDDGGAEGDDGDDVLLSEVICMQSRRSARVLRFEYRGLYGPELFAVVFMELCMVLLVDQKSECLEEWPWLRVTGILFDECNSMLFTGIGRPRIRPKELRGLEARISFGLKHAQQLSLPMMD